MITLIFFNSSSVVANAIASVMIFFKDQIDLDLDLSRSDLDLIDEIIISL